MQQLDKQLFLQIKQRLDHYHIPALFPIEVLPLVQKLVNRLDKSEESLALLREKQEIDSTFEHSRQLNQYEEAINMEMRRLLKQNNDLRRTLLLTQQQREAIKQKLPFQFEQKILDQRINEAAQAKFILNIKDKREQQLLSELQTVKYKYNELMDLIHEDSHFQKQYIKRLLKHKKIEVEQPQQINPAQIQNKVSQNVQVGNDEESGSTYKKIVSALEIRLESREMEIIRLQKLVQEGSNFLAMRRFKQKQIQRKQAILIAQIESSRRQNEQLKKQTQILRLATHGKEVLARKIQKMKNQLLQAKQESKRLKTNQKERQFDFYCIQKELQRKRSMEQPVIQEGTEQSNKIKPSDKNGIKLQENYKKQNNGLGVDPLPKINQKNNKYQCNIKGDPNLNEQYYFLQNFGEKRDILQNQTCRNKLRQAKSDDKIREKGSADVKYRRKQSVKQVKQVSKQKSGNRIPLRNNKNVAQTKTGEQILKQSYQRLLQQKNKRIFDLQSQVKQRKNSAAKVTTKTQNINSGNLQTNNLIIKNNKNQYITFNQPPSQSNKSKEDDSQRQTNLKMDKISQTLAATERERDKLIDKVKHLQQKLARRQEKSQNIKRNQQQERNSLKELETANEGLKNKLQQTKYKLIKTNQENLSLQRELNEMLKSGVNHIQKNASQLQKQQEQKKDVEALNLQESRLQLIFLRREVKRLSTQISILRYERDILAGKLKETELALAAQAKQMRRFQKRIKQERRLQDKLQ